MPEPTLCTVCTVAQLPDALALAESWREAGGAAPLLVVADAISGSLPEGVVAAADLGIEGFGFLAGELTANELARALVPFALQKVGAPAVFVQPELRVRALPDLDGDGLLVADGVTALATPQPEMLAWWMARAREGESPPLLGRFSSVQAAEGVDRWVAPRTVDPTGAADARAGYTTTADGLPLEPLTRLLVRRARLTGALTRPVFDPAGAAGFRAWLTESVGGGMTRITLSTWLERDDLQAAYPDLTDPDDRDGLEGWLATYGVQHLKLPPELLPGLPESIAATRPHGARQRERPWGVNVVGEDIDALLEALDVAGIPALPVDPGRDAAPFAVNLIWAAAEDLPRLTADAGDRFFRRRRTIMWTWSSGADPSLFRRADEVWVASPRDQRALAPHVPVPVVHMPPPVAADAPPNRAQLGLPEGFLAVAGADSAAAEAFARAFGPGDGATLLVAGVEDDLIAARPCVETRPVLDLATFASADVCLALRQTNGFDRALVAAAASGTPIVTTMVNGPIDGAWLVPLEPSGDGWAPDIDAAAAALRAIRENPQTAAARAAQTQAVVLARHAPVAASHAIANRLQLRRRKPEVLTPTSGFEDVRHRVAEARERIGVDARDFQRADPGRVRRGVQSRVRRTAAPFEAARRRGDEALADALEALERETEAASEHALVLYADALARARRAERDAAELTRRLHTIERRLDALDPVRTRAELDVLVQAARGIPYMAGEPYSLRDHPIAGRVLGYRDSEAGVAEQDTYRFFEDVFRGSEDRVRELLAPYVELVRDYAPVLDVGCGRGEFLDLLTAAGIEARGVDSDAGMAARATARGLDVTVADGVEYLRGLADESLGAITAFQVIEHLPTPLLEQFLLVARRKLRPGGLLIVETVNPHAGHALKTFWVDPTHQQPLFPEVVLTLVRGAGFREGFICHLAGARDVEVDRYNESSYAVVGTA